ncbi:head maturation protease, ClpP-related [Pseudomonas sp. B21-053]|uniref:head maturation protease, ClpP-related n=1 Tax=Pseudomonas sp. B21-053 TaxID=2895493 RepID=UPI00222ED3AF|nr:head maturation protease, ClpP-related [Pseudomonas sp. B21-053]UZE12781.1 Clp protease ClpP [Pseudomonas sp. B21-053]
MTLKTIPAAPEARPRAQVHCDLTPKALERWNPSIKAASTDDNSITIYDPIGYDWWTGEGVTAKRISAALRSIGDSDVVVKINSPGGDVFEGLAIYNLFREHKGKVTVQILGLAASAASFIAMAADEIQIARAGFLMIHNSWTMAAGDRNDIREVADFLEQIDGTLADIYAVRTGDPIEAMRKLMDVETWMGGAAAIDAGFADSLLSSDAAIEDVSASAPHQVAARRMDLILAKQGMPRSERRALIQELKAGTPGATTAGKQNAAVTTADLADPIAELQAALSRFSAAATQTGVKP